MHSNRSLVAVAFALATMLLFAPAAQAIPLFARQVQQSCVACHVGGQYPELTPYGRFFKLTGYTAGDRQALPLAMSLVAGQTGIKNNSADPADGSPNNQINQQNNRFKADNASIYAGGKITDNLGLFAQFTYAFADHPSVDGGINDRGHFGADNIDLRYADRRIDQTQDLIWGLSLNNNPTLTDVFNSAPGWSYPYMPSSRDSIDASLPATLIESYGGGSAAGLGIYAYIDKHYYAELDLYRSTRGAFSLLGYGNSDNDEAHLRTPLKGLNPYVRLAYTTEWDESNLMLGAFGMSSTLYPAGPPPDFNGPTTRYKDLGVDAQYQFISDPHVVSAQFRYIDETIDDQSGAYTTASPRLKSTLLKATYVYRAKYGANLGYKSVTGSADPVYANTGVSYAQSANASPNTTAWIPSVFWQVLQNARLTLQYTAYTKFLGAKSNYNGLGRNASDNDTTWLYLWLDW